MFFFITPLLLVLLQHPFYVRSIMKQLVLYNSNDSQQINQSCINQSLQRATLLSVNATPCQLVSRHFHSGSATIPESRLMSDRRFLSFIRFTPRSLSDLLLTSRAPSRRPEVIILRRSVHQNALNRFHDFVRQQRHDLQRLDILLNLTGPTRSRDHARQVRVLETPGQRQLSGRATEAIGNFAQLPDLGDLDLTVLRVQRIPKSFHDSVIFDGKTGIWGDAVVVFASEETRGQRRPSGGAHAEYLVQRKVFLLDTITMEHVVLRLLHLYGKEQQVDELKCPFSFVLLPIALFPPEQREINND